MGTSYLPITQSWKEYIVQAEEMYDKVTEELKESLMKAAEDVLRLLPEEKYVIYHVSRFLILCFFLLKLV